MKLKKILAANMAEAMIKVKNELGDDAIILQTRRVRRGGFLGIGSKMYVEVTAMQEDTEKPFARLKDPQPLIQESASQLKVELEDIKHTLKSVNDKLLSVHTTGRFPEPFGSIHSKLIEDGLHPAEAASIIEKVTQNMTPIEAKDKTRLSKALKVHFDDMVKTEKVTFKISQKAILIGPTGVGKTTTLAKIAAMMKMKEKIPLTIVTLDTYRIAAAQQLKTYADIMHIPFKVVYTPQEAEEVSSNVKDNLIIVDTAGRSQKNELKITEIFSYVRSIKPDLIFLVIDATKKRSDVEDIIEHFSLMKPTHIILTKLDETSSLIGIMEALKNSGLPLSFVTNGQNVPEDIMYADEVSISSLIVKEVLQ